VSRRSPGAEGQQGLLSGDVERVRRYGSEHPDHWAGVRFDNGEVVKLVAGFTDSVPDHARALRQLVDNPDRLVVVPMRFSQARRPSRSGPERSGGP
jgi:hypothetical protein